MYVFLKDWQNFFHLPLVLMAILLPLWNKYRASVNVVYSGAEELRIRLLDSFNMAVNLKGDRFREMFEKRKSENVSDGKVFNAITQPITQIRSLSENLLVIFREVNNSRSIKLTTIICKDNEMVNFVFHSDFTPKVTISELSGNDSAAKKCLGNRNSILYSNINSDNFHGFYQGSSKSNVKSIFCYPIAVARELTFILSFTSSKPNVLRNDYKNLYEEIISEFENRFVLEWYLDQIKNN